MAIIIAVLWLPKYLLNILTFGSNLVISSLETSRGGILGTFFPFRKVFNIAQYDFMELERSSSFLPGPVE